MPILEGILNQLATRLSKSPDPKPLWFLCNRIDRLQLTRPVAAPANKPRILQGYRRLGGEQRQQMMVSESKWSTRSLWQSSTPTTSSFTIKGTASPTA